MNDPHVEVLHYRFKSEDPTDDFSDAQALSTIFGDFKVELKDQMLEARPQIHFPTPEEAKEALEPHLSAWEQNAALNPSRYRIHFEFDRADVVDRNPTPGVINVHSAVSAVTSTNVILTRRLHAYPDPDNGFVSSDLTETMVRRFRDAQDGREGLTAMAYWALTVVIKQFGGKGNSGRRKAAIELQVDPDVLRKLGELTSDVDDPVRGRKAGGHQDRSLSEKELRWIEIVVARLIRRVGEHNHDPKNQPQIGLGDFPLMN